MPLALSLAAYAAAIISANYLTSSFGLIPVGWGLLVTTGTFAAGAALLARDYVHNYGGLPWALAAIATAATASWFVTSPAIAVASAAAFCVAELVDLSVYTPLRRHSFVIAVFVSGAVAAPVDTVLFLYLAGFELTLAALAGQFIAKVLVATLVPLALWTVARAVLRQPVHA